MTVSLLRKKFTVNEFQQMAESGILKDEERVELLEGEIIEMGKIGSRHAACVNRSSDLLRDKLGQSVLVRSQNPIELSPYSQPQPELAVVRRREDYYESGHPQPEDILLLIEVSDSTHQSDRQVKIPLYARSGIREVWLINLNESCIETYRQPTSEGYQEQQRLQPGQSIAPLAFEEIQIMVDEVLGFH